MSGYSETRVLDVSGLPAVAFGRSNVSWLGNIFYMTIEGTMFALMIATYFYLRTRSSDWPPGVWPPDLRYGVANGIVFLLSVAPAFWVQIQARAQNRVKVQIGLLVLLAFESATVLLRVFEFTTLNCHWTQSAYASTIWTLLGLHAGHIATEWIETATVTVVAFTDRMEGMRFADVDINSNYWYFVVGWVVVIDFIIYGTTRLL
jgi:cytochrome c oxidase subunit 3